MINIFLRTRVRYSRLIMSNILFMGMVDFILLIIHFLELPGRWGAFNQANEYII